MRNRTLFVSVGLGLAWGWGCGGPEALAPIPEDRQWLELEYAQTSPAQRLDLYLPPEGEGPFPLLVWVHGGGWQSGDKWLSPNASQRRALGEGFALASLNYRLSGEAAFPAQIHDVKTAIRWLRAHRREHRLSTERIGVWGNSAGGHLVALLGTSGEVAALEGSHLGGRGTSSRVQAVVDWAGPTDLGGFYQDLAEKGCPTVQAEGSGSTLGLFLGASPQERPDLAADASPITYVTGDDPPFMIQHGEHDCVVPVSQALRFQARIEEVKGPGWATISVFDQGHGGPHLHTPENLEAVLDFFALHIR